MKFTVLGKSPAWQDAGGACSGYLISQGDTTILVDCGNGAFGKLRKYCDYVDVDAVVISHLHADHYFDLIPFAFGLTHAPRQQPVPVGDWPGTDFPAQPALYAPPGAGRTFKSMCEHLGVCSLIEDSFDFREYDPAAQIRIGEMAISFRAVPHYIDTWAIEVSGPGGRITYGADCRPNDALIDFAGDTDLLIAEATLPRPERDGVRGHMTPGEAGEHAAAADAKRLVLTHISDELDPGWAAAEAAKAFEGPLEVAFEGLQINL
jgi:ribonuclease BN (tRNA processing enzyme)